MNEIARETGISLQSVSRILSGKAKLHSKHTVRKVEDVATRLGYFQRQNIYGVTRSVGIIVDYVSAPAYLDFVHGANAELLGREYLPISLTPSHDSSCDELVDLLLSWRVDGIILRPDSKCCEQVIELINKYRMPVVTVEETLQGLSFYDHVGLVNTCNCGESETSRSADYNYLGWQAVDMLVSRVEARREISTNRHMLIDSA